MVGTDASEGQALWQPGGAEEVGRLREGNRHLHLACEEEEEEEEHNCHYTLTVSPSTIKPQPLRSHMSA